MQRFLLVVCLLGCASALWAQRQVRLLTLQEAEQLLLSKNPQLKISESAIEEARANLRQSRSVDNPEISIEHNINNPVTHHFFDCGYEGQTDVQVSQHIFIGGQRLNGVRKSQALVEAAQASRDNTERQLLHDLREDMLTLRAIDDKAAFCDKAIQSLQTVCKAYDEQVQKGNLPSSEAERIRTMLFEETKNKQALATDRLDAEHCLQLLLGLGETTIIPDITFSARSMPIGNDSTLSSLPSVRYAEATAEAARHEVSQQRSNALPQLSITGEWDKNGSIGHNFFGAGVSITVPLFNRNRGAIKAAEEQQRQALLARDYALQDALAGRRLALATISSLQGLDLSDSHLQQLDTMMENATTQFMHRNITLLEFADYYSAYRDARYSIIDSRLELMKAENDLRAFEL